MKDLLVVLLILLTSFIVVAACTGGYIAITSGYLPLNLERLTHIALAVLPFSIAVSVFFVGYRMFRKPPRFFFLTYLLVFLAATATLCGLYKTFATQSRTYTMETPVPEIPLTAGEFIVKGGIGFYAEREENGKFFPLITADPSAEEVLKVFNSANFDPEKGILRASGPNAASFPISGTASSQTERTLSALRSDIRKLNSHILKTFFASEIEFLIIAVAIVLFSLNASFLLRLTRWPLFNAAIFLCAFRGFFFMYRIFIDERVTELGKFFLPTKDMNLLPAYIALDASALFLLWGLILVRAERKENQHG
ncbi:MAG TPA: hypothetical protein PLG43_12435 [Spirochaetia bacterium]|nr:hypothetical protein [Spirochaetia bacterium]